jgi:hypothetical protein
MIHKILTDTVLLVRVALCLGIFFMLIFYIGFFLWWVEANAHCIR